MQGMAKRHVFDTLWTEQLGTGHDELTRHVDRSYLRFTEVLEAHYLTHDITPITGCLETFAFLREQGIAIALIAGFYRKVTDIILRKLGWLEGLNATPEPCPMPVHRPRELRLRKKIVLSITGNKAVYGKCGVDVVH